MVLIHNMDSDEEQLQIVSYEEPEAYAATSHSDNRMGIKMTPKVPSQFDGQSSWFEYEDLIDDWLGITTLDADKHGPSLKNALIGSASFYKSMLDNALLRDPDRGLTHFKDTLRPYFVKGVNHVFLWRFLQMFRTYRGQSEFVHWIGRFEIAQKRLLASWSDLLDISDLPDAGTPAFTAALTDEQRLHYNQLATDEEKLAYQQELREQTVANRRTRHAQQFPLSDNLMSLIFLVQADLNEQQRERFVSSMNIRQIAMPQYTYLQVKQLFLELFAVSRTGVADPNITHRKRSNFYVIDEGETEEGEFGFLMKIRVKKVSQVCTLRTNSGFSAPRVHTLSAASTAGPSRKVNQKVTVRKEEKDQDPASARGQKVKVLQHGKMTSKTQLSGEKARAKEKVRKERKEWWKERILSKECLHGREKEKVMRRTKEETIHFCHNLHKQM